jgi:4-amino-4-deoxy-L-arabinose transferase-like glycosyltransferase
VNRGVVAAFVLLTLLPLARVASTHYVFSRTIDEPVHVEAGNEWLTQHTYDRDPEHPPLARAAEALASRFGRDDDPVIRARAGNLPFLAIALVVVALWTSRLFGNATALLAVAIFGALPPVLAHSGLATTDCAAMAMTALALYRFDVWLEKPSWRNAIFCAVAVGLGLLSKFSFVIFFPMGAIALIVMRRSMFRIRQLPAIVLIAMALVWAGYKFTMGSLNDARLKALPPDTLPHVAASYDKAPGYEWVRPDLIARARADCGIAAKAGVTGVDFADWAKHAGYPSPLAGRFGRDTMAGAPPLHRRAVDVVLEPFRAAAHRLALIPIPAPLFFAGIEMVRLHSAAGHPAFFLGRSGARGWWYYFPVIFFFKSPLAFVVLAVAGVVLLLRNRCGIALAPILMFIPPMLSSINIGVRHILPVYPLLAICAAYAAMRLRWIAVLLLIWYFAATALAHPDYLAYFNEAAGRHPEAIAVDSNLDWGQDLKRLGKVIDREHLAPVHVAVFGDWNRYAKTATALHPNERVTGWVALSETMPRLKDGDGFRWLDAYKPVKRVGKSIRLYYIAR